MHLVGAVPLQHRCFFSALVLMRRKRTWGQQGRCALRVTVSRLYVASAPLPGTHPFWPHAPVRACVYLITRHDGLHQPLSVATLRRYRVLAPAGTLTDAGAPLPPPVPQPPFCGDTSTGGASAPSTNGGIALGVPVSVLKPPLLRKDPDDPLGFARAHYLHPQ